MWSIFVLMLQGVLPAVAANTAVELPSPPTAAVQPVVVPAEMLSNETLDVLRQRIADRLRGKPISNWYAGVPGNFKSNFSASDVLIQTVTDAQKGDVTWVVKKNVPGRPEAMTFMTWPNYTNNTGTFNQTLTKGFTSTHEWSTTTTLDIGVSLEVSVGIPMEAEMKETVSENLSVSNTNTNSKTVSQDISYAFTQPVPPDSALYAAVVATPLTLEADWSATIVVDGYGFVRGNLGVPLGMQLSTFLTEAERTFRVSGTYSGVVGTNFQPCTETFPVGVPRPGRCP